MHDASVLPPTDADHLHIFNVTSSSLKLRWNSPDPKLFVYFEVAVTRLHDHALVLKTNVSGTELSVDNLESSQTYHAVVVARSTDGQIISTRKGIMTTSESTKHVCLFVRSKVKLHKVKSKEESQSWLSFL